MNRSTLACTLLLSSLTGLTLASAQESGYWRATSKNATSITGDIGLAPEKISINFTTFTMAQIRALTPAEIGSAFDLDQGAAPVGHLYRTSIPGDKRFLHKNTLCGSDETQWVVTFITGRTLQIAFFSSADMPVFTREAIANNPNVCGTFTYSR